MAMSKKIYTDDDGEWQSAGFLDVMSWKYCLAMLAGLIFWAVLALIAFGILKIKLLIFLKWACVAWLVISAVLIISEKSS